MNPIANLTLGWSRSKRRPQGIFDALAAPGLHERQMKKMFNGKLAFDGPAPVLDIPLIIVAFTNRSGSNLVCDYLRQTGRIAGGGEFLNHDLVARQLSEHGDASLPDYIRRLAGEQAGPNRAWALKAGWDQLAMMIRAGIPAMFSRTLVLHCFRHDLLAQSISYAIALKTGRWTSAHERTVQDPGEIDLAQVEHQAEVFNQSNLRIRLLCSAFGLKRMDIGYERLCGDGGLHLVDALRVEGIVPPGTKPRKPALERQTGAENARLTEDFLDRIRSVTRGDRKP